MKALTVIALALMASVATAGGAATAKLTTASAVKDLLANPATAAVLKADIPTVVNNPMLSNGMDLPLASIAQFEPQALSPEVLKKIDADLAAAQK